MRLAEAGSRLQVETERFRKLLAAELRMMNKQRPKPKLKKKNAAPKEPPRAGNQEAKTPARAVPLVATGARRLPVPGTPSRPALEMKGHS